MDRRDTGDTGDRRRGVELSPKYKPLFNSTNRYFCVTGGRGSGKSFAVATFAVLLSFDKNQNILFTRYTNTSASISIKPQVLLAIKLLNYESKFDIKENLISNITNGNKIYFKGLKAGSGSQTGNNKGFEGISCMIIDEADEIPNLNEFETAELSIRVQGVQNRIIMILNPCSTEHWIYKEFYESERDDITKIHTTYLDNLKNLNESIIKKYEKIKEINYTKYKQVVLGGWGKINTGGEFYPFFDENKHVSKYVDYDPNSPLFISVDENVVPYNTLLVCQIESNKNGTQHTVKVIDEICEFDKNLEQVCNIFKNKYSTHKAGLFIFGDATSQKKDTKLEAGYNYYTLILKHLAIFKPILRVGRVNPAVILTKQFADAIMNSEIDSINILINRKCHETIKDFENCKLGKDGKKDKSIFKDSARNISYQKYGHTSDALFYLITEHFQKEFKSFQYGYSDFKGIINSKKSSY